MLFAAGLALVAAVVMLALMRDGPVLAPLGIGLAVWLITGSFFELVERAGMGRIGWRRSWTRLSNLPRSTFGTAFAHAGLGVVLLGIVSTTAYEREIVTTLSPGNQATLAGYTITYQGNRSVQGSNYRAEVSDFVVENGQGRSFAMAPSKRFYTTRRSQTTEAAILTRGASQLYLSIGEMRADGGLVVRAWHKPLVVLIWGGAIMMALAGLVSLSDRRLRVGAPRPARRRAQAAV